MCFSLRWLSPATTSKTKKMHFQWRCNTVTWILWISPSPADKPKDCTATLCLATWKSNKTNSITLLQLSIAKEMLFSIIGKLISTMQINFGLSKDKVLLPLKLQIPRGKLSILWLEFAWISMKRSLSPVNMNGLILPSRTKLRFCSSLPIGSIIKLIPRMTPLC